MGATGQLGADVVDAFSAAGFEALGLGHSDLDVTDGASVLATIAAARPSLVVNTAAFHNLDKCEASSGEAFAVNAIGARNVAVAAQECGAVLVHISTDYVFDGAKASPYDESDLPAPLNVYGASKLAGEHLVRAMCPQSFVVRTSGLYGPNPCRAKGGLNFPLLMIKLAVERGELTVVTDEVVGPTYTPDLARQLVALSATDAYGIIHATGVGQVSWHAFAKETLRLRGLAHVPIHEATATTMVRNVRRPAYSILSHGNLRKLGILVMRPWQEALAEYVDSLDECQNESA
ncbi:dTDP-4-dehydrorhamnose reductase [Mycolicibacterium sphagni]|uniref:dTDP-4-dehydrorhamnose reductase n=1 Tax=Mycolicibacterium sphagni TaxID=1786 RepID=UPI0013FD3FBB|nr:dTDP-4-dehydrorhamnose reductase [Mycolicibacterium sphagni]